MSDRSEALRRAQEAMRRLQHEVRTPIGQIIGYSELLEEELEDRDQQDLAPDLERIRQAAQRLLDLVDGKLHTDPGAPPLPDEPSPGAEPTDEEPEPRRSEGPRVLVVDADGDSRDLVARRLEQQGFRVERARDGVEALRRIDTGEPLDLVLLEVLLPGMNGLEVLERVRRKHSRSDLPVILQTGLDGSADCIEGLERGANDYVTKPIDFPVLVARLHVQLQAHETAKQVAALADQLEFRSTFIRQALGREVSEDLLVEMAETPDATALGGERRRVTALCVDVRDGRALGQSLEPGPWVALLRSVLDSLAAVVERYQGTLDAVTGDGLIAVFGLPLARDDEAEHATACGIALQLEIAEVNARNRRAGLPEVRIGVGVATGDVVVVGLGQGEQLRCKAVGEPLMHAARLEAEAAPGEVRVDTATLEALGDVAYVDREDAIAVPGCDAPVRTHRVLGLRGAQLISLRD